MTNQSSIFNDLPENLLELYQIDCRSSSDAMRQQRHVESPRMAAFPLMA